MAVETTRYTNANGRIISQTRNGVRHFIARDPQGSVSKLYAANSTLTDTFTYWADGSVRTRTGGTQIGFQFLGTLGCRIDNSGLFYMRARYYDPRTSRWMTVDPLWPSEPAYQYCRSNPTTFVDPNGFSEAEVPINMIISLLIPPIGPIGPCSLNALKEALVSIPERGANKGGLAHCLAACLTKVCGGFWGQYLAWSAGVCKETIDYWWPDPKMNESSWDPKDVDANHRGEACGSAVGAMCQCGACCNSYYPVKGYKPPCKWTPPGKPGPFPGFPGGRSGPGVRLLP